MDAPNNYNINLEEEYIMKDNMVIINKKLEQLSKPVDDHMEDIDKKKGPTTGCAGSGSSAKCCQADNCSTDLTDAKQYHRRHKVCEHHAKAQVVIVAGIRQRFCQQCSRFHEVSEFDEAKRSCRRRLAGHNERRRKNSSGDQPQEAEGSSSSGRKGNSGTQMKDIDDHHGGGGRGKGRLQISIQENSTNYNHFQIT